MKNFLIILTAFSLGFAQNINSLLSDDIDGLNSKTKENIQQLDITDLQNLSYTPVENSIDPDKYLLGPGDLLGISIISVTNISMPIRINPVGEVLIPSVGVINIDGISLSEAKGLIEKHVHENALPNSIVDVTLLDLKRFKIQILGAVNNPGYVYVTSIDGVYETIINNGGIQKIANQNLIKLNRDGEIVDINLKKYLNGEDLSQNILVKPGDVVYVPFSDYALKENFNSYSIINDKVIVYGFVNRTSSGNAYNFYPGYTVRDYIALAGGAKEQNSSFNAGNINRVKLYRADGTKIKNALNELVLPGDIIEVPPSLLYQIVGGDGVIRTLASIASSAYIIYKFTQD